LIDPSLHPSDFLILNVFVHLSIQSITMNLSPHASVWKPAHEEDAAREKSAFTGTPIVVTPLLSLGQYATILLKQKQKQKQQNLHQPKRRLQLSDFAAPPPGHWRTGVDSPPMKHHLRQSNDISNDTTASGNSSQRDVSQHSRAGISADTASGRSYQRNVSQHSRGGTWTDDHSQSSHTSTSSGTTSCTGNSSSHGTHPFATAAAAAATLANPINNSRMSHHYNHSLLGDLGKISFAGEHESSHHPYYNAVSMGHPPRKEQQHAPPPSHPYSTSAAGVATTQQMRQQMRSGSGSTGGGASTQYGWTPQQQHSSKPSTLDMGGSSLLTASTVTSRTADAHPILSHALQMKKDSFVHMMPSDDEDDDNGDIDADEDDTQGAGRSPKSKEKKWLLRMNRKLAEIPVGELDPATIPLSRVMNTWAETKTLQGATMVEMWLKRAEQEYDADNDRVVPTAKMYAMAGT
jgi:hypothetical protein